MTDISHLSTEERDLPAKYADFVKALKKPGDDIIVTLTGQQADLLHMAIGLSGEVAELLEPFSASYQFPEVLIDRANVIEELGDIEFFLEGIYENVGRKRHYWIALDAESGRRSLIEDLVIYSGKVLDAVKRHAIYGKELDREELDGAVEDFENTLSALYHVLGVDRNEVINHNVNKLSTRYASLSYSDKQAQDRADKA